MPIAAVATHAPSPPVVLKQTSPERSKTDWKVHALVVLAHTLILIGVALAVVAACVPAIPHPMIAMGSSAVPIIAGVLALDSVSRREQPPALAKAVNHGPKPLGLENPNIEIEGKKKSAAQCWLASLCHLFFDTDEYRERLEKVASDKDFAPLIEAQDLYLQNQKTEKAPVAPIDLQTLRNLFHGLHSDISGTAGIHEDPTKAIEELHVRTNSFLPLMEQIQKTDVNGNVSLRGARPVDYFQIQLQIQAGQNNSFSELFTNCFSSKWGGDEKFEKRIWFTTPPKSFLVQAERFYHDWSSGSCKTRKISTPMDFPENLLLDETLSPRGAATYTPDLFIEHRGLFAESGHYVAYINRGGTWWCADDSTVFEITPEIAHEKLRKAYLVHYTKLEEEAPQLKMVGR